MNIRSTKKGKRKRNRKSREKRETRVRWKKKEKKDKGKMDDLGQGSPESQLREESLGCKKEGVPVNH
jgi:hypothetical protein